MSKNNRFEVLELLKGSGDYAYQPALIPANMTVNSDFATRSADLFRQAGAIIDKHEAVALGEAKPLEEADYADLAMQHQAIADAHEQLARDMKASDPVANIQAISAHGDAMGAHTDACNVARMMLPSQDLAEYNAKWRNASSNSDRNSRTAVWDNENKNWNKAHRAFVMSRMAYNYTAFDTGA